MENMSGEKRKLKDRRAVPTPVLCRFSLRGLRKKARRKEEDKNYYVDSYETHYFALIVGILLLCILDAYFTFSILQHGGSEMNPFMADLIWKRPVFSLIAKYIITAVSLVILIAHKNFQVFRVVKIKYIIYSVFIIYAVLVLYEVYVYLIITRS